MASDYRLYLSRTVLVQADDIQWTGTLIRESATALVLDGAALQPDEGDPVLLDGVVVIERARVVWVQVA